MFGVPEYTVNRSLDYDGRLVRLQVYLKFNTIIHRQQALFLAPLLGNK
jgi:hypothetical protein